jgi:hypothetical protein
VSKLKAQRNVDVVMSPPEPAHESSYPDARYHSYAGDQSPDVDMTGSEAPSPTFTATHSRSQQPSISPALLAQDSKMRHDSHSSQSTDHRHYSYSVSASTSPAFGPQLHHYAQGPHSAAPSTLTSPALAPQRDLDQEATAALLMLNQTDRRGTNGSSAGRGMSVRELLST